MHHYSTEGGEHQAEDDGHTHPVNQAKSDDASSVAEGASTIVDEGTTTLLPVCEIRHDAVVAQTATKCQS